MTTRDLHDLLEGLDDTYELVIRRGDPDAFLASAWRAAADEACGAYCAWLEHPGALRYAAYLAAEDQADAALAALDG